MAASESWNPTSSMVPNGPPTSVMRVSAPDRDAPRVRQHPGGDEQAVRAEHDEGGPAQVRDRAEGEHPRQGGLVAVTSGSRHVEHPGTGRRRGRGGEVGGKRPGRRVHTPILATNHELHVSSA